MKDIITIAAVNFDPVWGDSEDNLKRMLEHIEAQAKQGCDLIVFPETALTGYDDETGKLLEEKMHRRQFPGHPQTLSVNLRKSTGYMLYTGWLRGMHRIRPRFTMQRLSAGLTG
jgi:hypothetical protein